MAGRTVATTRTGTADTTPNRRNSAALFFGDAGARIRGSFRRQLPSRAPNASAVASAVVVDSQLCVHNNGNPDNSFDLAGEMTTSMDDHDQTNLGTTDSINSIR